MPEMFAIVNKVRNDYFRLETKLLGVDSTKACALMCCRLEQERLKLEQERKRELEKIEREKEEMKRLQEINR